MKFVIIGTGRMVNTIMSLCIDKGIEFIVLQDMTQKHGTVRHIRDTVVYSAHDINSDFVVGAAKEYEPDWIISANNMQKIKDAWFEAFDGRMVNFHNAPLPKYRGLNACTWAIWNKEKTHGVTWHLVDREIDSGAIVAQQKFPVADNATALSLIQQCIIVGEAVFENEVFTQLLNGRLGIHPQQGEGSYYSRRQLPNDGKVDLTWTGKDILRFCRALDVGPYKLGEFFGRAT